MKENTEKAPNVVLIMVDQLRYDCLGVNGHPIVSTPNLNMMASQGHNFHHAYSAVPTCIPSRAALMTGLAQKNHGRVGYEDNIPWHYEKTIAREFTDLGYQTEAIGKMHVYPERQRMGFEHVTLHDGYLHEARKYHKPHGSQFEQTDDYLSWLKEKKGTDTDLMDDGMDCNSWVARPWMYEEALHPTNWVVTKSIEFLKRRDPTQPFFLKMSFTRPHAPLNPPKYYFDMYMDMKEKFPEIKVGEWAKKNGEGCLYDTTALKGNYAQEEMNRFRAGYYGSITHIDHQIGRFLTTMTEHQLDKNTIILFISDHGDQLGEHHLFRKAYPYQGSIHIPCILYDPGKLLGGQIKDIYEIVELRDIYPTLIDIATGQKVTDIDGISAKKAVFQQDFTTRDYLHGEHSFGEDSSQYILTKEYKYIWFPVRNEEQLFYLVEDPNECVNLADEPEYQEILFSLKNQLIEELKNREEGFVRNGQLVSLKKTKPTLDFIKPN